MHALSLRLTAAVAGAAVAASSASVAAAQAGASAGTRPSIGVFGGAALPTGSFGDAFKSGYAVGANIGFHPAASPVGFRIEGAYDRFDLKGTNPLDLHTSVISGTGNVVLSAGATAGGVRPYLIGGGGIYNIKTGDASDTKFGLNGGGGIDLLLSGITVYAEARFNYLFTDSNGITGRGYNATFVPIVVGVKF